MVQTMMARLDTNENKRGLEYIIRPNKESSIVFTDLGKQAFDLFTGADTHIDCLIGITDQAILWPGFNT
ncbi:MAG: hypothetical protein CL912_01250 [Deltaproteobacteria bacterium]|nr:hypothetical protein [Deltaproteobacteria bacterium]